MTQSFTWRDGERLIRFGRGTAAEAVDLLGGPGYLLLTTERAEAALPAVGRPPRRCATCRAARSRSWPPARSHGLAGTAATAASRRSAAAG